MARVHQEGEGGAGGAGESRRDEHTQARQEHRPPADAARQRAAEDLADGEADEEEAQGELHGARLRPERCLQPRHRRETHVTLRPH